jgi:predicted PurR-regulated permease PerM
MGSTTTPEIRAENQDVTGGPVRPGDEAPRQSSDGTLLRRLAIGVVGAAAGFYLLQALGGFFRPVLIAVLLCYAIWPLHARLTRFMNSGLALLIIGVCLAVGFYAIGRMVFANASDVWAQMPRYQERAERLFEQVRTYAGRFVPGLAHPRPSP